MSQKTITIATAVIVTIVGIVWYVFHRPANTADFPDGTYWICNHCGNNFHLTIKEQGEWYQKHYGLRPGCPKCGSSDTVRAVKCENCGKFFPMTPVIKPCPYCHHIPSS